MTVPNGYLTIERVADDRATPRNYVFSLQNSTELIPPPPFAGDFGALAVSYGLAVAEYRRGDLGVTGTTGTGKSSWANQQGRISAITPGTGATNGIGAVGTGLNSKASVITDGATQGGTFTDASPVTPGTTNVHDWMIVRFVSSPAPNAGYIQNDGGFSALYVHAGQTAPACNVILLATSPGNPATGVVANQWYLLRSSHIGGNDILRVGAHAPTPTTLGNHASTNTFSWSASTDGSARLAQEVLCKMRLEGPLAAFQSFDADASVKARSFWSNVIEI